MAQGIKDRVAIIGMGCTKFGERWDKTSSDLVVDASYEAFADAGIEPNDIGAAWVSFMYDTTGRSGLTASIPLRLQYKPVTHVENMCASGSEALRGAAFAVAAGIYDIALAIGVEKMKDSGLSGTPADMSGTTNGVSPSGGVGSFAMVATKYFARYGLSPQEGKKMLARISVKSHHNSTMSPKAHFQKEITLEQVINAPIVAWPLGLLDCSGVSDGAAAAIVVRAEDARKFRPDPVYIKSLQVVTSPGDGVVRCDRDYTHFEETYRAAAAAYAETGIKDPRKEISFAEVHDGFSIVEAVLMEDLQFSPRGRVKEDIESGVFKLDGQLPVQPDGGLKCFGHPIGASGLRMVYEVYKQLQGKAGLRQVKNPRYGLTHNMGGAPSSPVVGCAIFGAS